MPLNRNVVSRFDIAPSTNHSRTMFPLNFNNKLTFNAGDLVPIYVSEVLPGDTFNLKNNFVVRMSTPIHPVMDNLYIDTYFFYVPNRLIWKYWVNFMGENSNQWSIDTSQFVPPYVKVDLAKNEPGSVLNYLGVPSYGTLWDGSSGSRSARQSVDVCVLELEAYKKIFNDWFRDENLLPEVPLYPEMNGQVGLIPDTYSQSVSTLYTQLSGSTGGTPSFVGYNDYLCDYFDINSLRLDDDDNPFGYPLVKHSCLKVAKYHDYFTSALPQPQKGADVLIPASGSVDVVSSSNNPFFQLKDGNRLATNGNIESKIFTGDSYASIGGVGSQPLVYNPNGTLGFEGLEITVNNLRLAIQTQRILEKDARSGSRYIEILKSHFGVTSPDARLQRSEYLGGKRTRLNMSEVVQTSQTTEDSALGSLAGHSLTAVQDDGFTKTFVEHGYVIGVACVRPDRTYGQGLPRRYSRKTRFDYYIPELDNIGETPILNKELFIPGIAETEKADDVFGYQEAWAEYRTEQARACGEFAPGVSGSLDSWHYGDIYTRTPHLSSQWLYSGYSEVDRTLAVQSSLGDQFIMDLLITGSKTRIMRAYSVPGLMDHA